MNSRIGELFQELIGELRNELKQDSAVIARLVQENRELRESLETAERERLNALAHIAEMSREIGFDSIYQVVQSYPLNDRGMESTVREAVHEKWKEFKKKNKRKYGENIEVLKPTVMCRTWSDLRRRFGFDRLFSLPRTLYRPVLEWLANYIPPSIDEYGPLSRELMLARVRENHRIADAARAVGVHVVTLARWEMGLQVPRKDSCGRLADYLGVSADGLQQL
ncbi:helix-turn-helix domain-containing protein, partial [Desulfofundulus sp.]|uniref:helix-turn-helix domain-containing protein n=1 Tax=Desulfofundulus sp. TaxID=2282750 RepID=UPI003C7736FD